MPAKPSLTLLVMRGIRTPFIQASPCASEGAGAVGEYRPYSPTTARAANTMRRTRPRAKERCFRSDPKRRKHPHASRHQKDKSEKIGEHPEAVIAVKPRIMATPILLVTRDMSHSVRPGIARLK
jgi:hypothetical protein